MILKAYYKLQNAGVDNKAPKHFFAVVMEIINNNFQGAFSDRLNVKSQEFMDLEDCGPF